MNNDTKLTPVATKSAIIGKMWRNSNDQSIVPNFITLNADMNFSANESYLIGSLTFRTNRNLNSSSVKGEIKPISLKAGDRLIFWTNTKRPGFKDADYNVSVSLPIPLTTIIIENDYQARKEWKETNTVKA